MDTCSQLYMHIRNIYIRSTSLVIFLNTGCYKVVQPGLGPPTYHYYHSPKFALYYLVRNNTTDTLKDYHIELLVPEYGHEACGLRETNQGIITQPSIKKFNLINN